MITPIGGTIHVNQQSNAIISQLGGDLSRSEFQNLIAAKIVEDRFKHIQRVRPVESGHKIDPRTKHEEKKREQENENMGKKQNLKNRNNLNEELQNSEENMVSSHLDLKI